MALLKNFTNFVNNNLGLDIPNPFDPKQSSASEVSLPWENSKKTKLFESPSEVFFPSYAIDGERWNKLYPYRLLVYDVVNQKVYNSGAATTASSKVESANSLTGIEYVITQTAKPGTWEMVLPITPQQLQISDEFAISTSATMRGVVEEHNGVKFKSISASGTTGIWPRKPSQGDKISRPTVLGSVFGGTLQAGLDLANQASQIKSAFTGDHPVKSGEGQGPGEVSGLGLDSTGYYQALYLGQFLERYAQFKKNPEAKDLRLVLDMPKIGQSFIVTPVRFTLTRSEQKPNQFLYTMQFRAWKRIKLNASELSPAGNELPDLNDPNVYQSIITGIDQTRRTLSSAFNLVRAVRSDVQGVFENLRQVSLLVKDATGVAFSAADLPRQIIEDAKSTIEESIINLEEAFTPPNARRRNTTNIDSTVDKFLGTAGLSGTSRAGAIAQSLANQKRSNEGLSREAVVNGALGQAAAQRTEVDPLNNVFANPEQNFDLFNEISVDAINFSESQTQAIEDDLNRVRLTTINDLIEIKNDLVELSNQIADNYGAMDSTYAQIYNRQAPRTRAIEMSIEENEILLAIFETIQQIDKLSYTKTFDTARAEDSLAFVGGLAAESGIAFENYTSKTLAPVPFGLTIEEIAARYMGDPDKWIELVTVNKLRSPYIDEEGFLYNLLSNGGGRQFNVDDSSESIYVGQKLVLSSNTVPAFTRTVIDVERIGVGNYLVTLDGVADLEKLTTADEAKMQGYLPGTVNSQNQIYVPSNTPSSVDDTQFFDIPGVSDTNLARISKVDFLLDDGYDVAINGVGDFRLSSGLNNLIQALKLKIRTQQGTILRQLGYGLGLEAGVSVADINSGAIIEDLNRLIEDDPRFDAITRIEIRISGSTLGIDMAIQLAGNSGILPINFDVRLS